MRVLCCLVNKTDKQAAGKSTCEKKRVKLQYNFCVKCSLFHSIKYIDFLKYFKCLKLKKMYVHLISDLFPSITTKVV